MNAENPTRSIAENSVFEAREFAFATAFATLLKSMPLTPADTDSFAYRLACESEKTAHKALIACIDDHCANTASDALRRLNGTK